MAQRIESQRGLSRSEMLLGVAALVVVVVVAVMLVRRFGHPGPQLPDSTQQAAVSPTVAPSAAALYFEAGSAKLPVGAEDVLGGIATALRSDANLRATIVPFHTGGTDVKGLPPLARDRAGAIRHALEADGVSGARVGLEAVDAGATGASAGASSAARVEIRVQ